jgi:hypothetical protein
MWQTLHRPCKLVGRNKISYYPSSGEVPYRDKDLITFQLNFLELTRGLCHHNFDSKFLEYRSKFVDEFCWQKMQDYFFIFGEGIYRGSFEM